MSLGCLRTLLHLFGLAPFSHFDPHAEGELGGANPQTPSQRRLNGKAVVVSCQVKHPSNRVLSFPAAERPD
ncbi:hypothetical protein DEMA109039_09300 [Deinococcus marmoris]